MSTEKIEGLSRVTIELDLAAFAAQVWSGDDGEYQGDNESLKVAVVERLALLIHKDIHKDVREAVSLQVRDQVEARVGQIITDTLTSEFAMINEYGEVTRHKTTLREQIGKQATEWLSKKADRYSGPSNLEAIVKKVVDQQLAKEFLTIIADEKAKIVEQLRAAAAVLLAKEAAKQ